MIFKILNRTDLQSIKTSECLYLRKIHKQLKNINQRSAKQILYIIMLSGLFLNQGSAKPTAEENLSILPILSPFVELEEESDELTPSPAEISLEKALEVQAIFEKDAINEAIYLLYSLNCSRKCDSFEVSSIIIHGSQNTYRQLYNEIKNKNKQCQEDLLSSLNAKISFLRVHQDCLKEEYKKHPKCFLLNAPDRFSEIAELVYGLNTVKSTEAQAPCLECAIQENSDSKKLSHWISTQKWINTLDQSEQCIDPEPGQKQRIYLNTIYNDFYDVRRELDGSYSIPLSLRFSADNDYDGTIPKDQVPAHYMKKAQECIGKANEKMLRPNGKKLKIVIQEPKQDESDCNEDITEIQIGHKNHRSGIEKYASDIDCPTITHEVLHLLGLHDEYEEKFLGHYEDSTTRDRQSTKDMSMEENKELSLDEKYKFKPAYNCRPSSITKNSIMSDHNTRWNNVFTYGKDNSLLTSGQFNNILYGSCEKNKFFNECSQLAYETSSNDTDCVKKKHQCEAQNFSGQNKQRAIQDLNEQLRAGVIKGRKIRKLAFSPPENFEESIKGTKLEGQITQEQLKQVLERISKDLESLKEKLKVVMSWP